MTSRASRIWLNSYFLLFVVGIGGLQMYHVKAGLLTSYGADFFAPPYLYIVSRQGRLRMRPLTALLTVFTGCFLWEWAQRYDLGSTPLFFTRGTFDPWDLVAYAAGLLICYAADLKWFVHGQAPNNGGTSHQTDAAPTPSNT